MVPLAKLFITLGIVFILTGILLYAFGKIPGVGKLPGDILIKKEDLTFYFPLTTCILLSLIVSFLFFLWNQR
ncbi:MAG TPA: DUF2905 domain-containing protein [Candidatus Omnitrophota bacterium]|nr:DUF2905 domain-containing protein [Candidatus Omnitrophota bacterium]